MADSKVVMEWLNKADHFKKLSDDCRFLNRFYTDTRYPVHWPTNYTKAEAQKAKNASRNIRDIVKQALKLCTSTKDQLYIFNSY